MKFTKEQVFEKIKAGLEKTTLKQKMSDRSINEQIDKLFIFSNEEQEIDDFVEKIFPIFDTSNKNINNDTSVYIEEWKKNNDVNVSQQKNQKETKDENTSSIASLIKSAIEEAANPLLNKINELNSKVENNEKIKTLEERKLNSIAKAKNLYSDAVINVTARNFDFSIEDAENKFSELLTTNAKDLGFTPKNGGEHQDDKIDFSEERKRKIEQGLIKENNN